MYLISIALTPTKQTVTGVGILMKMMQRTDNIVIRTIIHTRITHHTEQTIITTKNTNIPAISVRVLVVTPLTFDTDSTRHVKSILAVLRKVVKRVSSLRPFLLEEPFKNHTK